MCKWCQCAKCCIIRMRFWLSKRATASRPYELFADPDVKITTVLTRQCGGAIRRSPFRIGQAEPGSPGQKSQKPGLNFISYVCSAPLRPSHPSVPPPSVIARPGWYEYTAVILAGQSSGKSDHKETHHSSILSSCPDLPRNIPSHQSGKSFVALWGKKHVSVARGVADSCLSPPDNITMLHPKGVFRTSPGQLLGSACSFLFSSCKGATSCGTDPELSALSREMIANRMQIKRSEKRRFFC